LAQRRLYARLSTEGNPYPSDGDIKQFQDAAYNNGLGDYANVQVAIKHLFDLTQNNALTGSAYYQQYEKLVNGIFLQTIAAGVYAFSGAQLTILDSIARQCPLSRGEAVLRARALLSLVHEVPVNYDNEVACLPTNREGKQLLSSADLRIYPNPASDILNIAYSAEQPAELRFFNSIGQQVMQIQLEGKEVSQVNVTNLQPGIYWYHLRKDNQMTMMGKLLISK